MTTATTNFSWLKPDVASSAERDRWGTIFNTLIDGVDSQMKTRTASYDFDGQQLIDAEAKGTRETKYDFSGDIAAAAVTIDYNNGNYQYATISSNLTITLSNFPVSDVGFLTLRITQDGTGGRTVSFAGGHTVRTPGGTPLAPSTSANAINIYRIESEGGTSNINVFLNAGMAVPS